MAKYKVVWTESAIIDLRNIVQYISLDHPQKSRHIFQKIKINALKLTVFPLRGRIVPEFKVFSLAIYRELIIKPWRLIYRIEGKTVYV